MTSAPIQPYLHAIFCDDVRQEVSGKMLYVGVYGSELYAPSFPLVMPKLAVLAHFANAPRDATGAHPLTVQTISLRLDDEVLLELDPGRMDGAQAAPAGGDFLMVLAPFQVSRPGRLQVRLACIDGSEWTSNALNCRLPPAPEDVH
jgi:hypothetical protein